MGVFLAASPTIQAVGQEIEGVDKLWFMITAGMQVTSGELLLLDWIPLPTCRLSVSTSALLQIMRRDSWLLTCADS